MKVADLTVGIVEKAIGIPAAKWQGRCYELAYRIVAAKLVKGEAVTSYPYVLVWMARNSAPGFKDVWTKRGACGAHFRFDIMKLYRTLHSAEVEAFKIATYTALVGEVRVKRFDEFIRDAHLDEHVKEFQRRVVRKWMKRRTLPKYQVKPGDPMDHGHKSAVKVVMTKRGGRVYRCSWCNVKVGVRRIPRVEVM